MVATEDREYEKRDTVHELMMFALVNVGFELGA
jgi:hypothetical protein